MIGRTTTKSTIFNKNYKGNIHHQPIEQIPIGVVIDLTTNEKILEEEQKEIYKGLIEIGALEEVEIAPYGFTASGRIRTKPLKSQVIVNDE
jgi:hypothetical protein